MNAAIIYWSKTGNTEKVAAAIKESLRDNGVQVTYRRAEEAGDLDWFAYDLVCVGFPSYGWSPPQPVTELLKAKFAEYRRQGRIKTGAPKVPGKHALVFCTYSGPHTGVDEAIPAVKYAGQFFAHLGFTVLDEWCIVGEFHGSEERSTMGVLGDIRGRPNADDLSKVREDTAKLLERMRS
jgi:flavorubredoxin